MSRPIAQTVELLGMPGPEEGTVAPALYLALFDHTAKWYRKWMHGCFTRTIVLRALQEKDGMIRMAIASLEDVIIPDVTSKEVYNSFSYNWKQIKYLHFIHSINILAITIQV